MLQKSSKLFLGSIIVIDSFCYVWKETYENYVIANFAKFVGEVLRMQISFAVLVAL